MSEFGHIMREIRGSLGLSQASCAARVGSTQRHISFLETGRSVPTPSFVSRLCRDLELSVGQRTNLFESAGLQTPYPRRSLNSDEIQGTLNMLEQRVLKNWPFPALVLDGSWTIVRKNAAFDVLLAPFIPPSNNASNLFDVILSPSFRVLIENWEDAISVLFFRLQRASATKPELAQRYQSAKDSGLFDTVARRLISEHHIPVHTPIRLAIPGGPRIQLYSILGQIPSFQDVLMEDYEVEFMVPADAVSEEVMRSMCQHSTK